MTVQLPYPVFATPDPGVDDWHERARCAETDPEQFFPEKGGTTRPAKNVCAHCEVRIDCLAYAIDHDEEYGIWGGLSTRERQALKRRIAEEEQVVA